MTRTKDAASGRPPEPREIRRRATPTPDAGVHTTSLPGDVARNGVRRLGFLGLVVALMAPSVYLVELGAQPGRVVAPGIPFQLVAAVVLGAGGGVMCALAWSRKVRPELLLDIGLVFEVVVAFAISLTENATPWPPDQLVRGVSWNCLWISMYVVAIPGTYGKSVLAAIASACMAPFGLLVASVANQYDMPASNQLLLLLLPPFVAAAWAIPAGRHLYRLETQVSKAKSMGSYELIEVIGEGGMGEVWLARHRMLARASAVKLIRPEILMAEGMENTSVLAKRFAREARATAGLRSPHTVSVYDYGITEDGSFYYVMELLDGLDLETLVRRFGPLPAGRVIHLLSQATKSLAEAHEKGLVHRDIKPRNLFACRLGTEDDFLKVLDFGLVKLNLAKATQTSLTGQGVTTGTPAYMAPEVAMASSEIDARADLYSLGCVGYWLLTGQVVFEAPNAMAMVLAHIHKQPLPPSLRAELAIPDSLQRLILRCLEKDPAERPRSAHELGLALAACQGIQPWTQEDSGRWWSAHLPQSDAGRRQSLAGFGDEPS